MADNSDSSNPTKENENVATDATGRSFRLRNMIRQNSEKIGNVAETVVLPINKRSLRRVVETKEDELDGAETIIDLECGTQVKSRKVQAPIKKFPIFIITISIIQTLIFLYGGEYLWLALCYDPTRRYEIWRYFTEMLVHKSWGHLLGNVGFQLILGLLLEIVHHWQRISAVYMSGVLGGALAVTIMDPKRYSLGASAGVYGLLTAHLATIILNWAQMDQKCCRLFWLLTYIGLDVGMALYVKFYTTIDSKVSHAGHLGGALAGFIAAVFILRNFEKLAWEKTFQKILAILSVILVLIVIIVNVAFPSYYLPTEFNFSYLQTYYQVALKGIVDTPQWETTFKDECALDTECANAFFTLYNQTLIVPTEATF